MKHLLYINAAAIDSPDIHIFRDSAGIKLLMERGKKKKLASYFVPFMQGFLEIRAKGATLNRDNLSMKWTEKRIRLRLSTEVDLYMTLLFNRIPQSETRHDSQSSFSYS